MALTDNKITVYADNVSDLSDTPNADGLTADQLKAFFDSRGDNEIKESINGICDDLTATANGASGADQIGATALTGGTATTTQGIMEELDASIKAIPAAEETYTNKTLTEPKINEDVVLTATATELNKLHGATASTKEINCLKGVTSAIQAQLNGTVKTTGRQTIAGVKTFLDEVYVGYNGTIREDGNSFEIYGGTAGDKLKFFSGDLTFNDDTVWTSANDGTGSGLDADKLDGVEGSGYVNSTTNQTVAGIKTFSSSPVVPTPTTDMQASTKKYADDLAALKINKAGDTMSGALAMGANKITGLANPTENTDAVNFQTLQSQLAALHNLDVIGSTSISAVAEDLDVNNMPTASGNAKSITAIETLIGEYVPVEKDSVFVTYLMTGVEEKYQFIYEYSGTAWTVATPTFSVTMANGATAGIVEGASGDAGDIVVTSGIMTLKDASVLTTPLTGYQVAATATDIAATDTINQAFGKAQKQIDVVDTNIGNLTYTEENYVTDGESVTASIDALDMQAKDTADLVSTNRISELKSISTLDTTPVDYLNHLFTVTGYAQSQAMPNNADGKALWSIKGLTAENLVTNGDFSNGATGWSSIFSTISITDNVARVLATQAGGRIASTISANIGDILYRKALIKATSSLVGLSHSGSSIAKQHTGSGNYENLSCVRAATVKTEYTMPVDLRVSGWDYFYVDDVVTYNLTTIFGSTIAATLTADACDKIFENYVDGTRSTLAGMRLFSRGKNLFDGLWELGNFSDTGVPMESTTVMRNTNYIKVNRSTLYCTSLSGVSQTFVWFEYDKNKNFLLKTMGSSLTTTANTSLVRCARTSTILNALHQLELGSTATPYEPYLSATAYTPQGTLRSVLDVSDSIELGIDGKVIKTQRISDTMTVLATPIITELETIGELTAYPNGSILAEPCYSGYATGASTIIGTATLPIKGINKVESISLDANGNTVRTDVTASCSVTTTDLTITNYDASKVYFYDLDIDTKYTTTGLKTYQVECPTGIVTHGFAAGATAWTLTANENKATCFTATNAGGAANIVAEPKNGKLTVWKNASGQTLTVKTASSTGVTIANAKTATLIYTGTDFIKLSEV